MGIPHFVRRLKEAGHGTSCELGRSDSIKVHTRAIIDCPGLAYHIYNQQRMSDSDVSVLIDSAPYEKCISKTIEFLDNLESYGFRIEGIFFDGALPDFKAETRIDRLKKSASSLSGFKILHDSAIKATRSPNVDLQRVLRSPDLTRARRELAAPPFLVPSLVEALLKSRYEDLVYVVPGEADPFCAALGRLLSSEVDQLGVTIFTNDSDLIVFDSGAETKVTMLSDLEEVTLDDQKILKGIAFCPASIAEKSKGSGLPDLAWLMFQDPHASVNELISRLPLQTTSTEQEQFIAQYLPATSPSEEETYTTLSKDTPQRLRLASLDARISEIIHQVETAKIRFANDETTSTINIYLPFLLEDPSSTSAWEIGADARLAAYKALQHYSHTSTASFTESKRSSRTITPSTITANNLTRGEYIQEFITTHQNAVEQHVQAAHQSDLTPLESWRLIIVCYVLARLSFLGKPIPSHMDVIALFNGDKMTDWRRVQLAAHFQAAYYSLRILFQVSQYILAQSDELEAHMVHMDWVQSVMAEFPAVALFFDAGYTGQPGAKRRNWTPVVEWLMKGYRANEVRASTKKRKSRLEGKGKAAKIQKDAGNPFAALSEE